MGKANTLRHLDVSKAMRRQVTCLESTKTIAQGITTLIKYKINALLTTDDSGEPVGVVSKTDIMSAFYAGLPIDSPLEYIMVSPPLFCHTDDTLEAALEQMRTSSVYRLYVTDPETNALAGALAYPDIVGLLYRYCHNCPYSLLNKKEDSIEGNKTVLRFKVRELMTSGVQSLPHSSTLAEIMEALSAYRFGAMLLTSSEGRPAGVISKTDLTLAYKHGVTTDVTADTIMSPQVQTCDIDSYLEDGVKKMIINDIHRLFVYEHEQDNIVGVLSLTDAARGRSGSCHGCVSSRIKLEEQS